MTAKRILAARQYLDAYHRRDADALVEKFYRARIWMRQLRLQRRGSPPAIPALIELTPAAAPARLSLIR
jgi:hypothetical protein